MPVEALFQRNSSKCHPSHSDRDPLAPCWVHDWAITQRHLVIVEQPLHINLGSLVLGTPAQHVFMDWKPEVRCMRSFSAAHFYHE